MYEVNNPENSTVLISENAFNHLRAVNVELVEALEHLLVCVELVNWDNDPSVIRARAAIALARG